MARLGDYVRIRTGKLDANASSDNGQYPFFTCAIEPLRIDTYSYDCECVLVAGNGDLNVKYYNGKFDAYQRTYIIESLDKNVLSVPYLYCFLDKYVETLRQQAIGGVIKYIKLGNLTEADIPIPLTANQECIVCNTSKINDLIALRKEQLAKLDKLVKSRFIELFGDLHSTKFPKCKMSEICNIKHGYAFSGEFFTEEDNNILLVTPGNFKVGGGFQEKKCKFFMGEYSEEYVLNCGDLIVTMTDLSKNMDTLGYSAIVPSTNRVYLHNQRIGLFVDMSENINKVFLMYFMQTNEYRDSIITSATGSTVHHTSPSKILDCDVFLPPIELQDQFAAFVEQTDKSKLAIRQSLDKLELLKKSLMQEYFG